MGTATITGSVKFNGKKPRTRPIDMAGADEKCAELHGGKRLRPDTVVLNENGTLRNVFVWVKSGAEGWSFPMPEGDVLLDQNGCTYAPHVQGMRTGQSLSVKTSDPTAHNVHGYAKVNRSFNRSQPAGAANVSIRMRRDEASPPMKVKCDIHPWMNAYVAVVGPSLLCGDRGRRLLYAVESPPRHLHDRGLAREVRDDGADHHHRRQRVPGTRLHLRRLTGGTQWTNRNTAGGCHRTSPSTAPTSIFS